MIKGYRIYGRDGHRQKVSFEHSVDYDFSSNEYGVRKLSLCCADKTGTHDYVDLYIERDTEEHCVDELNGQLSDGIFENASFGRVIELKEDEGK